jgi:aspartokinase-like uncharacterized kinase
MVVKVGGSLFSEPQLGPILRGWLTTLPEPVVVFPGGGSFADAVRGLDAVHMFTNTESHWLAIRSLSLSKHFLQIMLGNQFDILDPFEFFSKHDLTPQSWAVTSDSLALAYTQHQQASKLVLLKSVSKPEETSWEQSANLKLVDPFFPTLLQQQPIPVELISFRAWL